MNLNATLFGQMITFAILVFVTMKYVWPAIMSAMQEREKKIAHGLAAAEEGVRELELAQHKAAEQLRDVRVKAAEIIEQANVRSGQIVEEATEKARVEGERLLKLAKEEIAQEYESVKRQLREQLVSIAVSGAEKILEKNLDAKVQENYLDKFLADVAVMPEQARDAR